MSEDGLQKGTDTLKLIGKRIGVTISTRAANDQGDCIHINTQLQLRLAVWMTSLQNYACINAKA
jgi:hypothetical protein